MNMIIINMVQHGQMVKADFTHAGSPGLIPGAGRGKNGS